MTTKQMTNVNTRELKKELLTRVLLQEFPTYSLVAELARREEKQAEPGEGGMIFHERFRKFCAEQFDLTVAQLIGPRKPKRIAEARALSMVVAHRVLHASSTEIAKLFGRKDHSSVFHAKTTVDSRNEMRSAAQDLEARWQNFQRAEGKGQRRDYPVDGRKDK